LTDFLTEQEQIEQLKTWAKVYGVPALIGIVAGILIFYAWHSYQDYRNRIISQASAVYDEMLIDRSQSNVEATLAQADKLSSHYSSTVYSDLASLMVAQNAIAQKNYPEAIKQFTLVLRKTSEASTRQIVRLRLARLYVAQQQAEQALNILKKVEDDSFNGLINEVRGDAFLALHQVDQARAAYQEALKELPNAEEFRPLLAMKLDNLT